MQFYRAAVTTLTASVGGGVLAMILSYCSASRIPGAPKFDIAYLNNGVLGGLVAITGDNTIVVISAVYGDVWTLLVVYNEGWKPEKLTFWSFETFCTKIIFAPQRFSGS